MPRYKLTIEYEGTPFVGWQRQDNGPSVQAAIETAVTSICGEHCTLHGAGRTDAGVHALGQVAHLDLPHPMPPEKLPLAINFHLKPLPIAVLRAEAVGEDFHARFAATGRSYLYRIVNRRAHLALDRGRAWFIPQALDEEAMHEAAQALVGTHDFTSFRASYCQAKSPVRVLHRLDVRRQGEAIAIVAKGVSFLHHQVRNMVGTLRLVGEGKWSAQDMARALAARDRKAGGPTAPPDGLYLTEVRYD